MALRRTAFDAVLTPDSFIATNDGAATSGLSIQNHRGSKRGACDRCRGQKLRCLREDQSQDPLKAICDRCFKAGATCSFRTLKRTGRPRASHTHSFHGSKPKEGRKPSRPTINTAGHNGTFDSRAREGQDWRGNGNRGTGQMLRGKATDQDSDGKTGGMIPKPALSPSSLHDTDVLSGANFDFPSFFASSSTATLPWPDETMPSFFNDAGEASSLESFSPKYSRAFHTYQTQPMDIQIPYASPISNDEQSKDMGLSACGSPTQTYSISAQISRPPDEAMNLDLLPENVHTAASNPTMALTRHLDRDGAQISPSSGGGSTANFALFKDLAEKEARINCDEKTVSVNGFQHRRMQELSEFAMELYAQLAANDPQKPQPASIMIATAFQDQLEDAVGSVLKSSNTFLTLLTSFSTPTMPSSPLFPPPSTQPTDHDNSTCSSSDSGVSPSSSIPNHDDPTADEPAQHLRPKHCASSSDDPKSPPSIDMAIVLQLLTCYMHIIHLHSIMHARILDYMTMQHVDAVPPVFPGMQVGGVSLDQFGTFQVKLLLQISMHVLGEIELALGLPEEYSVGNKKRRGDDGRRGVLEASVSGGFVKCLMREEAWRGKRVECVRERLELLRRLLSGAEDL